MVKKCKVKGCQNKNNSNGYCQKHYKQIENHGRILENTRFEPNKIIRDIDNNVAYIILYDKQGAEFAKVIIDLEDVKKVKKYRWTYRHKKYVTSNSFKDKYDKKLTQVILNTERKVIHHKNLNSLDCRKENLIFAVDENIKNKKDNVFRRLIKNANVKNREISIKLGVVNQTVSRWVNGNNIPLKYIGELSNILGVEKEVLMNNFDVSEIEDILNKIDKFKEDNPDLPISISKNCEYVFPVEIENVISASEEAYFKKNIKNYQMILDKIK